MLQLSPCQRLRDATARAHAAIEHRPAMARLMSRDVRLEDYVIFLRAFAEHHLLWEPAIEDALGDELGMDFLTSRRKSAALCADLAALGVRIDAAQTVSVPLSPGAALGWLYVHEGATLGGQVILTTLRRTLGTRIETANAFLTGHRKGTAMMWRETRAAIDMRIRDDAAMEAAILGARSAFATLEKTVVRISEGQPAPSLA